MLEIKKDIKEVSLQDFLQKDLISKEKKLNDIIAQASSQLVLESMINKIKEFWNCQEFEFFFY